MADIQEIPSDNTEIPLDNENIQPEIQEESIEIQPEITQKETPVEEIIPVKPKAKGRPKGASNKQPSKPRPKRKPVVEETQVEEEYKENTYVPSSPRQKRISEAPPDVATIMLKMLQEQAYSRQARKQALYRSWFR